MSRNMSRPPSPFVVLMGDVVGKARVGRLYTEANELMEQGILLMQQGRITSGQGFCRAAVSCLRDLAKAAGKRGGHPS